MNQTTGLTSLTGYRPEIDTNERQESAYTGRIRVLSQQSEIIASRLERVLANMRPPPPSAAETSAKPQRQVYIEDHLQHAESSNERINGLLTEIEQLIG